MTESRKVVARYAGHRSEEYGPFKGRDGETVHGFRRFIYLVDEDNVVLEVKVRDEGAYKQAVESLTTGDMVTAVVELVARDSKLIYEFRSWEKG